MPVRKSTLLKVPFFCVFVGAISFYVAVSLLGRFAMSIDPEGAVAINRTLSLIIYGAIFIATILLGGLLFFRKMTKKEIFFSTTIYVALMSVITIAGMTLRPIGDSVAIFFVYIGMVDTWRAFIPELFMQFSDNTLIPTIITTFVPYLFVLFGKKTI